jgi:hypothetical protein
MAEAPRWSAAAAAISLGRQLGQGRAAHMPLGSWSELLTGLSRRACGGGVGRRPASTPIIFISAVANRWWVSIPSTCNATAQCFQIREQIISLLDSKTIKNTMKIIEIKWFS